MSDSHENWPMLERAIAKANEKGCEVLLFAGDLIAPPGIPVLEKFNGPIKFVWGNNEMERVGITRKMDASEKTEMCGDYFEGEFDGIKVFMNHYPKFVELAAKSGEYNLVIHGHTHEVREEKFGDCLLVNPGEIQGYKTKQSTFMIFDTDTKEITRFSL